MALPKSQLQYARDRCAHPQKPLSAGEAPLLQREFTGRPGDQWTMATAGAGQGLGEGEPFVAIVEANNGNFGEWFHRPKKFPDFSCPLSHPHFQAAPSTPSSRSASFARTTPKCKAASAMW